MKSVRNLHLIKSEKNRPFWTLFFLKGAEWNYGNCGKTRNKEWTVAYFLLHHLEIEEKGKKEVSLIQK